jgi:hypothetical protein
MLTGDEGGDVKRLTQAEKNYLIKRIDSIAGQKLNEVGSERHAYVCYGNKPNKVNDDYIDLEVFLAITTGTVELSSQNTISKLIKAKMSQNGHVHLNTQDFLDKTSLRNFNKARSKKNEKLSTEYKIKIDTINKEASALKDQVMLRGNLAIELLEKFENKQF